MSNEDYSSELTKTCYLLHVTHYITCWQTS